MDDNGNVVELKSLWAAAKYFEKKFREYHLDTYNIYSFKAVDRIEGDFITDYSTTIEEQQKQTRKFNICWVFQTQFYNKLHIMDSKYYYIIYRNKWFNRWANIYYQNARRYFDKEGITVKVDILRDTYGRGIEQCTLVLLTGNCEIFYLPMKDVYTLANTKLGIFTDKWNQLCLGIPKEKFLLSDPNNYE